MPMVFKLEDLQSLMGIVLVPPNTILNSRNLLKLWKQRVLKLFGMWGWGGLTCVKVAY